jgi:hypothetical protein
MVTVTALPICRSLTKFGEFSLIFNKIMDLFGPKRDEVTGEWRKLHNEELDDGAHPLMSLGKSSPGD